MSALRNFRWDGEFITAERTLNDGTSKRSPVAEFQGWTTDEMRAQIISALGVWTVVPVAIGVCAHCHRDILDTDATDETGTLHFEPCTRDAAAMIADMLTDRARDEAMMREVAK